MNKLMYIIVIVSVLFSSCKNDIEPEIEPADKLVGDWSYVQTGYVDMSDLDAIPVFSQKIQIYDEEGNFSIKKISKNQILIDTCVFTIIEPNLYTDTLKNVEIYGTPFVSDFITKGIIVSEKEIVLETVIKERVYLYEPKQFQVTISGYKKIVLTR